MRSCKPSTSGYRTLATIAFRCVIRICHRVIWRVRQFFTTDFDRPLFFIPLDSKALTSFLRQTAKSVATFFSMLSYFLSKWQSLGNKSSLLFIRSLSKNKWQLVRQRTCFVMILDFLIYRKATT